MLSAYFNQSSNSWILPAVTSLEQTSSTIKHVYIAKSEFRQDLIVDKLKHAFFKYLLRLSESLYSEIRILRQTLSNIMLLIMVIPLDQSMKLSIDISVCVER